MKGERGSRSLPVLVGMALSLVVLILVVNRGYALTQCDLCHRNAEWKAAKDCGWDKSGGTGGCYYGKYKYYEVEDCNKTSICPGGGTITGSADCESEGCREVQSVEGGCGKDADPGAGTICANECWGKSCTGATGTCKDVSAKAPNSVLSVCHSQCGCSPP